MAKTVLITGATRGIGTYIAQEFKTAGYYVIGVGQRQLDNVENVDQYYSVNLSDETAVDDFVKVINSMQIDVLVNNAGINNPAPFTEVTLDNFKQTTQVNLFAPFRLCQAVLPGMQERHYGRIVNISSIWGKISRAGVAAYSATKFGIDGMTVAIANEYAKHGIMANSVSPGFVNTEMTKKNLSAEKIAHFESLIPAGRLAEPIEIARTVAWLASENNTYISGQNIACDGGFTRA